MFPIKMNFLNFKNVIYLILSIIFILLSACSIIDLYENPNELYKKYLAKSEKLEEYKIIYNIKFKFFTSDFNEDSFFNVGIFKKNFDKKIILESNIDYYQFIMQYFFLGNHIISCNKHDGIVNGQSEIRCEELNDNNEMYLNYFNIENYNFNISNDINIIKNGTKTIINRKCHQLIITFNNISKFYNKNELIKHNINEKNIDKIQISSCIDKKTGLSLSTVISIYEISGLLDVEKKFDIIEFTAVKFNNQVDDSEFNIPTNFSIVENLCNQGDLSILIQTFQNFDTEGIITLNSKQDDKILQKFNLGNIYINKFEKKILNLDTKLNPRDNNFNLCLNNECNLINCYRSTSKNKFECFKKSTNIESCNSDIRCKYDEKRCNEIRCGDYNNESECIINKVCKWRPISKYGDFRCTKRTCDDYKDEGSCNELSSICIWMGNSCKNDNCINSKLKDYCYSKIAVEYDNLKFCDRIKNEEDKHRCIEKFAEKNLDSNSCFTITMEHRKSNCLKSIAEKTGNYELCSQINRTEARNNCYFWVAKKTNNKKLCELIDPYYTTTTIENCYSHFAINNTDLCSELKNDYDKFNCYYKVTEKNNDEENCKKIKYEVNENCNQLLNIPGSEECHQNQLLGEIESKCWILIAKAKKNVNICRQINNKNKKGLWNCLKRTGEIHADISICDEIEIDGEREACITFIAKNSTNLSICDQDFKYPIFKNSCIFSIAQNNDDELICEKISETKMREECIRYFTEK
jgi:hypothetical protein